MTMSFIRSLFFLSLLALINNAYADCQNCTIPFCQANHYGPAYIMIDSSANCTAYQEHFAALVALNTTATCYQEIPGATCGFMQLAASTNGSTCTNQNTIAQQNGWPTECTRSMSQCLPSAVFAAMNASGSCASVVATAAFDPTTVVAPSTCTECSLDICPTLHMGTATLSIPSSWNCQDLNDHFHSLVAANITSGCRSDLAGTICGYAQLEEGTSLDCNSLAQLGEAIQWPTTCPALMDECVPSPMASLYSNGYCQDIATTLSVDPYYTSDSSGLSHDNKIVVGVVCSIVPALIILALVVYCVMKRKSVIGSSASTPFRKEHELQRV